MVEDYMECPYCEEFTTALLESEDAGEGTEHTHQCTQCGESFRFEVGYVPHFSALN